MATLMLAPVRLFCFDPDLITLKSRNVFGTFVSSRLITQKVLLVANTAFPDLLGVRGNDEATST